MPFSININSEGAFPVITLHDAYTGTSAEVYTFGALLNSFTINGAGNIVDGFASTEAAMGEVNKGFKSAKLSPFVCRLAGGKYSFNGVHYIIDKFYLGEEAIHGLLYDAPFTIADSGADEQNAFVSLRYAYNKAEEGFPFPYTCAVTYTLEPNNRLSIETVVTNTGNSAMPVCDGWHPYFTLGGSIDHLLFEMNAGTLVEFDKRLIPTGQFIAYEKFQQAEPIGNAQLDNCFVLNDVAAVQAACVLENPVNGLRLSIWPSAAYPYLQVYTPEHRRSIAIENLSALPDAFNNGIGLQVLPPAGRATFSTAFEVSITL